MDWWYLIGVVAVFVLAAAARAHRGYWYQRGLTDGIEIESSLRENRRPRWQEPPAP